MPRARSHSLSNLTPSQRWTAAMRLADGDPPVLAAALADASPDGLERLLAEDAGFQRARPCLPGAPRPAGRRVARADAALGAGAAGPDGGRGRPPGTPAGQAQGRAPEPRPGGEQPRAASAERKRGVGATFRFPSSPAYSPPRQQPGRTVLDLNGVLIEDTFAEAFPMRATRVLITADEPRLGHDRGRSDDRFRDLGDRLRLRGRDRARAEAGRDAGRAAGRGRAAVRDVATRPWRRSSSPASASAC